MPDNWRNRIVGHANVDPKTLVPNERNWRRHPTAQAAALDGILSEVGTVQSVIVNKLTGRLVDGHLRLDLALKSKQPTVPVVYVELEPEEEALVLATLDPVAALAEADSAKLDELLRDVTTGNAAVIEMLSEMTQGDEAKAEKSEGRLEDIPLPAPEQTWILIGIPTKHMGQIQQAVDEIAANPEVQIEMVVGDGQ